MRAIFARESTNGPWRHSAARPFLANGKMQTNYDAVTGGVPMNGSICRDGTAISLDYYFFRTIRTPGLCVTRRVYGKVFDTIVGGGDAAPDEHRPSITGWKVDAHGPTLAAGEQREDEYRMHGPVPYFHRLVSKVVAETIPYIGDRHGVFSYFWVRWH
jgi:hypothetical protein